MKKLIFVDNDNLKVAEDTLGMYVKRYLENYGGLKEEYLSSIEIVSDFWRLEQDNIFELAFNKNNAIVTWSVYTRSLMTDSKLQILRVLRAAGDYHIKGCTYIDTTNELIEALTKYLKATDAKGVISILKAIECNNIITLKDTRFGRIRVCISSKEDVFYFEPIMLLDILNN